MQLQLHTFDLRLRHVFTISRESISIQPTLIVELEEDGFRGYGEAPSDDYYGATIAEMSATLNGIRDQLQQRTLNNPAELWDELAPHLQGNPFAQCALDEAAHDLWGKKLGLPTWKAWGLSVDQTPLTNYTIGIDSVETMVAHMQEFPDWPIYKIKLGTKYDLEIVTELRQHTRAAFRVDANCAWTASETIRNSREFAKLGVEFIEQPLPADHWQDMKLVHEQSALPVIADESCQFEADVQRCAGYFHGVNIKLVKCGGLTPARRMIAKARQLGLRVMVGCMNESSVGISSIAQLLPLLDYVDMDGALLLAEDIATGVSIDQGACRFPEENGCGVKLIANPHSHT
jgi:L-alanine-DL-glutamate epimerase-like enolase superfamily enzyme